MKAMALKPEDRYASAKALADDVERWMADEPVTAWREPPARRARRWARRNRTVVASLAAAWLVALAGTAAVLAVQTQANGRLKQSNIKLEVANDRVTHANADLKAANEREKQRFDLAMEAIKLFHGEVGDDLILKADQFKPLRDRLLKGAADFYRKLENLLENLPDRSSRGALGNAYFELGELTSKIGDKPAALAAHRKGLEVRRELAVGRAKDTAAHEDVVTSLNAAGELLAATGKTDDALEHFREARGLLEDLPLSGPGSDGPRCMLGRVDCAIGKVQKRTGKTSEALESFQRSVETLTRLVAENPAVTEFQSRLADSHNDLGILMKETGKLNDALKSYHRALAIRQRLANDHPDVSEFQSRLASSHITLGMVEKETGKPVEALESYRRAREIQQKLADLNPAVTEFRATQAVTHLNLGNLEWQTGKPAEALESFRRGWAVYHKLADENPAVTEFRKGMAISDSDAGICLGQLGKLGEALEAFRRALPIQQKLADLNPTVTDFRSDLAYTYLSIGWIQSTMGNLADSLQSHRQALAIQQELAQNNPSFLGLQSRTAFTHNNIGSLESQLGMPVEAFESHRRALAIQEKLVNDNPSIPDYRNDLAITYTDLGEALSTFGRTDQARDAYARAVELREKLVNDYSKVTEYRNGLARSVRRLGLLRLAAGDAARGVAETRRAAILYANLPSLSWREWYELACCHSALAGGAGRKGSGISAEDAEAEAVAAIDLLRRSFAEGLRDAHGTMQDAAFDRAPRPARFPGDDDGPRVPKAADRALTAGMAVARQGWLLHAGLQVRLDKPEPFVDAARDLGEQVGRVFVAQLRRYRRWPCALPWQRPPGPTTGLRRGCGRRRY